MAKIITKKCGIYCVENLINGNVYVGQSVDIEQRFRVHKHYLSRGNHRNSYLQNAYNKYGHENFSFYILQECSEKDLDYWEVYYIEELDSRNMGYNLESGGIVNRKHSEKTLLKMSLSQKGRTFSDETRKKMSLAQKGKSRSEEFKRNVSKGHKGIKFSESHKENLSKSAKLGWIKRKARLDVS